MPGIAREDEDFSTCAREALRLSSLGYNVLPTETGKKHPTIRWRQYQHVRSDEMLSYWWTSPSNDAGIFTVTGSISDLIVLDIDSDSADDFWRSLIGPEMDSTTCVKTHKGHHYWFSIGDDEMIESWSYREGGISFDVKAEGGGVMTPPSPHPDGGHYSWLRPPEQIVKAPEILTGSHEGVRRELAARHVAAIHQNYGGDSDVRLESPAPTVRADSTFTTILARVPHVRDGDGRNVALAQLLGPLAGRIHPPVYNALAHEINEKFAEPLTVDEFSAVRDSIWQREERRRSLLLQSEVEQQRLRLQARRILAVEEADALFVAPLFRNSLTDDLAVLPARLPETIEGLHRKGANALVASRFKAGKTTLMGNVVKALADCEPFLGEYPVDFEGRIALFNYELDGDQMTEWLGKVGIVNTDRITTINLRGLELPRFDGHKLISDYATFDVA